ncbi:hypothetical protein N7466_010031 [Penicillium verhagenii]|uniref:uncharacterized protein n=1 Tax=Penicillium verhagenii TaxID=1562060 RepID=UPI002544E8A7|nr:uncharacterized protein N7466_010031 [Penicillium verhagenii]KAJ5919088.1 hypothetical protein N7466_010031 [Penicillium verhagenii]
MDPTAANIKDGSLEKYSGRKLLCVTLRFYVRYRSKISFGLDDTVIGLAMLGQLAWAGVIIGSYKPVPNSTKKLQLHPEIDI